MEVDLDWNELVQERQVFVEGTKLLTNFDIKWFGNLYIPSTTSARDAAASAGTPIVDSSEVSINYCYQLQGEPPEGHPVIEGLSPASKIVS
jgi:hypothetical protein